VWRRTRDYPRTRRFRRLTPTNNREEVLPTDTASLPSSATCNSLILINAGTCFSATPWRAQPDNSDALLRLAAIEVVEVAVRTLRCCRLDMLVRRSLIRDCRARYDRIWWPQPMSVLRPRASAARSCACAARARRASTSASPSLRRDCGAASGRSGTARRCWSAGA
jgi:hypothetical protein